MGDTSAAINHPSGRSVVKTDEGTLVQVGWSTRPSGRWKFNQMWEIGPKAGAEPVYHFVPKGNGSRTPEPDGTEPNKHASERP